MIFYILLLIFLLFLIFVYLPSRSLPNENVPQRSALNTASDLPETTNFAVISSLPPMDYNSSCQYDRCGNYKVDEKFWINGKKALDSKIKIRGHSSAMWEQKSYTVHFQKPVALTDIFPKTKKYVLYAPYFELNRIQNPLTYYLSNIIGVPAPVTAPIILWINESGYPPNWDWEQLAYSTVPPQICNNQVIQGGDSPYRALYWLFTPVSKDMVGLKKGDFLIEFDRGDCPDDAASIITSYKPWGLDVSETAKTTGWSRPIMKYPDADKESNQSEKEKAGLILTDFVDKLFGPKPLGNGGEPSENALKMIDIDSWAKYFILSEFASSVDGYMYSTYMYIKNGKIYMGPPWDYNEAYGSCYNYMSCRDGGNTQFWRYAKQWFYFEPNKWRFGVPQLYARLLMSTTFRKQLFDIYTNLRNNELSDDNVTRISNYFTQLIRPEIPNTEKRWPKMFDWYHYNPDYPYAVFDSATEALNTFIKRRLKWLDENMVDGPEINPKTGNNGYMLQFNDPLNNDGCGSSSKEKVYTGCDKQTEKGLFYSVWPAQPY